MTDVQGRRDERRARVREEGRAILVVLGWAVLAAAAWLAFGAIAIGELGKDRGWPVWWFVGASIPAGVVIALMRRASRGEPRLRDRILWAFLVGGAISIGIGATLNGLLIVGDIESGPIWWVGITEEGAKLVTALALAGGIAKTFRTGAMLGAAVGFGFAVAEDAGYFFGQYVEGMTGWAEQAEFVVTRALVGGGMHALFSALIVGAVAAAWGRPSARRILGALLTALLVAAIHSGYDWVLMNGYFGLVDDLAFEPTDLLTIGLQLVLLLVLLLVLRRSGRAPEPAGSSLER